MVCTMPVWGWLIKKWAERKKFKWKDFFVRPHPSQLQEYNEVTLLFMRENTLDTSLYMWRPFNAREMIMNSIQSYNWLVVVLFLFHDLLWSLIWFDFTSKTTFMPKSKSDSKSSYSCSRPLIIPSILRRCRSAVVPILPTSVLITPCWNRQDEKGVTYLNETYWKQINKRKRSIFNPSVF